MKIKLLEEEEQIRKASQERLKTLEKEIGTIKTTVSEEQVKLKVAKELAEVEEKRLRLKEAEKHKIRTEKAYEVADKKVQTLTNKASDLELEDR
jgi:hypothetical protein